MENLTEKEKALLKIIEEIVAGFETAYGDSFKRTIVSIDKALDKIRLKRGKVRKGVVIQNVINVEFSEIKKVDYDKLQGE
jgi:hypothetical protein